jgi:sirohydrochlorin cobaltochelatase
MTSFRAIALSSLGERISLQKELLMYRKVVIPFVVAALVMVGVSWSTAGGHGEKKPVKKAMLLVAFGTSVPQAQKAFDQIEAQARKTFPDTEIRWAFTSKMIRAKLAKQGKKLDPPVIALAKLMEEGFTHVVVASFHSLPGAEFHDLYTDVQAFKVMRDGFRKILVSRPLLSSRKDMERVAKAVIKSLPKSRKPEDAVLMMGHGSEHHPGDAVYAAMGFFLEDIDPNAYVGTVEGQPTLQDIIPKLKKKGIKKAYLVPLMAVAGDHARNDMAGDEPESWKSMLKKEGIESVPVLVGTAEIPEIVAVWLDHVKAAFQVSGSWEASILPRVIGDRLVLRRSLWFSGSALSVSHTVSPDTGAVGLVGSVVGLAGRLMYSLELRRDCRPSRQSLPGVQPPRRLGYPGELPRRGIL